jgi:tRNA uridine 5-carboxymethylaminomethyl modification enzyme
MLREDNADLRLTETAHQLGLVDTRRWAVFHRKREAIAAENVRLRDHWVRPADLDDDVVRAAFAGGLARESRAIDLLRRPEVDYAALVDLPGVGPGSDDPQVAEQVEYQAKYAGYIERQQAEIDRHRRHQETRLPEGLDYSRVRGLSAEVCEKLIRNRPVTVGQASRIPGMTPAAVSLLLVHLKRGAGVRKADAPMGHDGNAQRL